MAYIIDDQYISLKESIAVEIGADVTISDELNVILDANTSPSFSILNDGTISIGSPNISNSISLNGGICYNFKKIIDGGTNYVLQDNDYFIEVVSPTYLTVTLPLAASGPGCSFIISRSNSNTSNINVVAQIGDDIDDRSFLTLKRAGQHIKVISNGENSWYVV